ncbi:MAG: NAD(+) diphosphatase [Parvularculaceae bacterium]
MSDSPDELCLFAAEPLDRASELRADADWIAHRLADERSFIVPLYKGDPLIVGDKAAFLSAAARAEFPREAQTIFLGLRNDRAYFALDASAAGDAETAPFAAIGRYTALREAAASLSADDLAVIGQGRWLLDWHRRHSYCANCGGSTEMGEGGAKRVCALCEIEHFPRTDPVAIILAVHEDSCLLGRNPRFPPGFVSALAGFVEAAETPEACAIRELREEAGVVLKNARYQFSQPWPFPSSLMMGFLGDAESRTLKLDEREIVEAHWVSRSEVLAMLGGAGRSDLRLPPRFTIARRLIERWAQG